MAADDEHVVFIGFDGREAVASHVAANSIRRRTFTDIKINYLKHRELRKCGLFSRPWLVKPDTGDYEDLIDAKPFTTEFSHTRFLVPALQDYQGWALFMDADMIFQSDIKNLFNLKNNRYAVMCVQHKHKPKERQKMDGQLQTIYHRKNWSSFVLWNCSHPSNEKLTKEKVNFMKGADLHAFSWLQDHEIGSLPPSYNFISGVSPPMQPINDKPILPDVIHYTDGGPWFEECKDVPFAHLWTREYEEWCRNGDTTQSCLPTVKFDRPDKRQY